MLPIFHYFTYRGRRSLDFNTKISGGGTFDAPERDVEKIEIPGRSGDLLIDNGKFRNVKLEYEAYIVEDFEKSIAALRSFLLSEYGYFRLEDTYHPNEYRMAAYCGPLKPKVIAAISGSFTLEFDCMPQRFLKSGDTVLHITEAASVYNPTLFEAKPKIIVHGTGSFTIGSKTYTLTANSGNTVIDSEMEEVYEGSVNRNPDITLADSRFPVLKPGTNPITLSGVTLDIVPRWFIV